MSRAAALAGFERFVDDTIEATRTEFRLARALRGTGLGPGGAVLDRLRKNVETLERRVVEPELARYRQQAIDQFRVLLDAVDSDEPITAFEAELLAGDSYVDAIDETASAAQRQAVRDDVLARLERLGEAIGPLVEQSADEFYPALERAYDRDEALALVDESFPFTGPLRRHRQAITFEMAIDPGEALGGPLVGRLPSVSVEYTDEALRAMQRAERQIIDQTKAEIREQFDNPGE